MSALSDLAEDFRTKLNATIAAAANGETDLQEWLAQLKRRFSAPNPEFTTAALALSAVVYHFRRALRLAGVAERDALAVTIATMLHPYAPRTATNVAFGCEVMEHIKVRSEIHNGPYSAPGTDGYHHDPAIDTAGPARTRNFIPILGDLIAHAQILIGRYDEFVEAENSFIASDFAS